MYTSGTNFKEGSRIAALFFFSTVLMLSYNGRLNTLLYEASHGSVV